MNIKKVLVVVAAAALVSCGDGRNEIDEPLSASKFYELLTQSVGFSPQDAKLLYS
jgi:hypothetical protein